MTIFYHEMKASMRSTVSWIVSLIGVVVFFLMAYPAFAVSAEDVRKIFAGFPPELLKAMNISVDNLLSVLGFYAFIYTYIVLCGSIQAMILGASLMAKEFNRKTADFLFTKPVRRISIITQKISAGILLLVITDALVIMASYLTALAVSTGPVDTKAFFMISFSLFFVEMMFYSLGILIAVIKQRLKPVLGVSMGTVFGFFVLGMLGAILDDKKIRYIVPFQYYDPLRIIREPVYETQFAAINILFVAIALIASYSLYIKRDIHSA